MFVIISPYLFAVNIVVEMNVFCCLSRIDAMSSLEMDSHGCRMSSLALRLLGMNRAPGFVDSSWTVTGRKGVSREDRRRLDEWSNGWLQRLKK
jgi:hypothetical protein